MPKQQQKRIPKDMRRFIEPLIESGWQIVGGTRHARLVDGGGRVVTTIPSSPSDGRGLLNCRAVIRRAARERGVTV